MAYHGVLIPEQIAAMNVDSYNRHVVDAADIDNGWIFTMGVKPATITTGSMAEVWDIAQPTTTASIVGATWMAYSGDEVVLTDSKYKGLDPDPRNFYNKAGYVFSAYKPQVGDVILATAEVLGGSYVAGGTTHVNAVSGSWVLYWGTSQQAAGLSYKLIGVRYISLATGAIDDQRETAYEFECVGI